jgi:hypothetical protein
MKVKHRWIFLVVSALEIALYVGGYFVLPHYADLSFGVRSRRFPVRGLSRIYTPLGWLECKLSGRTVDLWGPGPGQGVVEFDPGAIW